MGKKPTQKRVIAVAVDGPVYEKIRTLAAEGYRTIKAEAEMLIMQQLDATKEKKSN